MNELYRTLEDALSAAPPDSDTRELVGQALDILDTIPMESLEIMAKVERARAEMTKCATHCFERKVAEGLTWGLAILTKEFPDAT